VAYTDGYNAVSMLGGTFTASATTSTVYFNEPVEVVAQRLRRHMNTIMPGYAPVAALGLPLVQYEYNPDFRYLGSNAGLGVNDSNSNAYRTTFFESDAYVQVFRELNYE